MRQTKGESLINLGLDALQAELRKAELVAQLYLAIMPDGGIARVEQLPSLKKLRARLVALKGQDVQVFVFFGQRFKISKGPHRYLVVPNAKPIPLFKWLLPEELEDEKDGYIGKPKWQVPDPLPEELESELEFDTICAAKDPDDWAPIFPGNGTDEELPP